MSASAAPPSPDDALAALRAVIGRFRHPVALLHPDGAVLEANDAFRAMLAGDEADGGSAVDPVPADERAIAAQLAGRVPDTKREAFVTDWDAALNLARRGEAGECRLLDIAPDGAPRWLRFLVSRVDEARHLLVEGSAIASAQIAVDTRVHLADGWRPQKGRSGAASLAAQSDALASLTAELRAERAERERRAAEAEARARALFTTLERIADGFYALDREGRFTYANAHALRLLRVAGESVTGRTLADVVPGIEGTPFAALHAEAERTGAMRRHEGYLAAVEAWLAFTVYPGPTGVTVYLRDVSEERELRARTIAAQRTEAMALLAGSIAHDFNNVLTALFGGLQLVRLEVGDDHPAADDLADAEAAVQRAAGLARQLLRFSRREAQPTEPIDVGAVVESLRPLLQRLAGERITTGTDLAPDLPPVRMDPALLEQALIDLVARARAAMPDGGALEVRTAAVRLREAQAVASGTVPAGDYVRLTVRDDAGGLPADDAARLLRSGAEGDAAPGSGLGLIAVRAIATQSGGAVDVRSGAGGTAIELLLPAVPPEPDATPAPDAGAAGGVSAAKAIDGRGEHVLLVEDEPGVRAITSALLRRHGYRVTVARHGADGIEAWRRDGADIALVVSDMRMPTMNGRQLLAALRAEGARCPVLFISGYPLEVLEPDEHPEEGVILAKPFEGRDLLARARALIDERPGAAGDA